MPVLPALRLRRDDAWCLTWRNCVLFLWQRVTVDALRATHEVTKQLHASFPDGLVTVSCMLPGAPLLPSADARAESLRLMEQVPGMVRASAAVFEGSGLLLATARVFISAIMVAATRSGHSFKVFSTLEKVAPWIVPLMEPSAPPSRIVELGEALARGRAMHRAVAPIGQPAR
jgi:hypothetical protein